jgi:hypothetical protein
MGVGGQERPGTHCIAGWVGPRTGMDGCGKSPPPSRDSNPLTVLLVANRYTDYAIAAHKIHHAHVTLLPYSEVQVQPTRNARRELWATDNSLKCVHIHYSGVGSAREQHFTALYISGLFST